MSASCVAWSTVRKLNSCDTCSSTTYPLSSCPEGGNCSECTNYSKNGNSCTAWAKAYKLNSCKSGYTKSGNTCIPDDTDPTCTVVTCSSSTYPISWSCPAHGSCSECTPMSASCVAWSTVRKLNSCDTCSSTTYPLSSCPDHGNCSECTNYSKNGNSCTAWAKAYKLNSCESGWHKSWNTCEKDGDTCTVVTCSTSTYPISWSCPTHGSCSECTPMSASCVPWSTVRKLDSCDTCSSSTYPISWSCPDHGSCSECTNYSKNGNSCAAWSKSYKLNSCDTCSSTTYPISWSCPAHGSCSECTNYSKNGNSCTVSSNVYKLNSCECGYYKNGNSCTACGAKKYSSAWSTSCSTADVWYYANSSCSQTACTNGPTNSHYTSNASTNSCSWECDDGYEQNWTECQKITDPCEGYNLTSCPTGWNCSSCPSDSSKKKLNSCDTCSSTTYPLTSQWGVAHASSYSSCTSYTKNGNSCTAGSTRYRVSACVDQNGAAFASWPSNERLWACPTNANCSVYIPYSPSSDWKSCVAWTAVYHFESCKSWFTESPAGSHNCVESSSDTYSWFCETSSKCENKSWTSHCPSNVCTATTAVACGKINVCQKVYESGIWPVCAYVEDPSQDDSNREYCCQWNVTSTKKCMKNNTTQVADSYCSGLTVPVECRGLQPGNFG